MIGERGWKIEGVGCKIDDKRMGSSRSLGNLLYYIYTRGSSFLKRIYNSFQKTTLRYQLIYRGMYDSPVCPRLVNSGSKLSNKFTPKQNKKHL